ncbi:hypothetical protein I2700191B6_18860 [Dorea formicigenerans]|jgi:RNA polymerase sigma factor (sigma-70 family)|uniref:Sigma-70 family RNA polymerase sigma factor n=1 Tax=Dorea formicigenerans TaxID=39486 RepID=A0A395XJM9_9FIRM|nr:sigma-70 family RNA polymerase sigma factor [Dorea formicigenerans]
MDRKQLKKYKSNKRRIAGIKKTIDRLVEQLDNVPVVPGKVTKSGDEFPYIEQHVKVVMEEPKEATRLKERIREKQQDLSRLEQENEEVERYISQLPVGMKKEIFEMVYLDGMTQEAVADIVGYSKGRVSQIISETIKD